MKILHIIFLLAFPLCLYSQIDGEQRVKNADNLQVTDAVTFAPNQNLFDVLRQLSDSLAVLEDSIFVFYRNKIELTRDTIFGLGADNVVGTGTTNTVAKWTSSTTLGDATLIKEDGTGIALGPGASLDGTRLNIQMNNQTSVTIGRSGTTSQAGFGVYNGNQFDSRLVGGALKAYGTGVSSTVFGENLGGKVYFGVSGDDNTGFAIGTNADVATPVVIGTNNINRIFIAGTGEIGFGNINTPLSDFDFNGTAMIRDGEILMNSTSDMTIKRGSGSPNGVENYDGGSLYMDETNNRLYVKTTDGVSTGWIDQTGNIYSINGTISTGRVVTLAGGASILFDGAATNDIKIGTGYIEAQNNGEIRALDAGDDGRFLTNGEQTQLGSASPFPHVFRHQTSNGTLTTPTNVSSTHQIQRDIVEGYYNAAFREAWEYSFILDSLSTAGNQIYGHVQWDDQDGNAAFRWYHDGDFELTGQSTTYETPVAYVGLDNLKRTVYIKNTLAGIRISGGSTSVTSGSPESITNDTPGTTTDLGSTDDWTVQGDSLEYSGTDTRKIEMGCVVDGDLSNTGVVTLAIDLNGTPIAASEMEENIGTANAKVDIPLLYIFSVSTNDVIKISVDIDSGTSTFANDNTICSIRAFDQ